MIATNQAPAAVALLEPAAPAGNAAAAFALGHIAENGRAARASNAQIRLALPWQILAWVSLGRHLQCGHGLSGGLGQADNHAAALRAKPTPAVTIKDCLSGSS